MKVFKLHRPGQWFINSVAPSSARPGRTLTLPSFSHLQRLWPKREFLEKGKEIFRHKILPLLSLVLGLGLATLPLVLALGIVFFIIINFFLSF